MNKIYYIGGSPCSGKSTIAEALAQRYDMHYFMVDSRLDDYIKKAAEQDKPICKKVGSMSPDEIWMRDPVVQCNEEFLIYQEIFDYAMDELQSIVTDRVIITEGAAYLPELIRQAGIAENEYLSIVPEREFQISHYRQREWIHFVLDGCSEPTKAFDNWMERDCLFAERVNRTCAENGYLSILNDGSVPVEDMIDTVAKHFGLH